MMTTTTRPPDWRHRVLDTYTDVLSCFDSLRAADRAARVAAGISLDETALLKDCDDELAGWDCPNGQYLIGGAADWEDVDALTERLRELPREELLEHLVRMIHHAEVALRCLVESQPGLLQPPPATSTKEESSTREDSQ